jgi:hypothetical protein
MTACIDTTTTWTGVLAFLIQASLVLGTVRAENTFWTTMWGSTKVIRKTRTDAISVCHLLRTEGPTKASSTGVCLLIFDQLFIRCFRAFFKCIPVVSWRTGAGRNVVEDPTLGIDATCSKAGIHTFVL